MFSPIIILSLFLSVSQIPSGVAQPVNASNFIIKHIASDCFPNAKGDLIPIDVHIQYVVYNATTQSWLTGLNPASGTSAKDKAMRITEAPYAKPFDANDPDMTADVHSLLATIAGNATAHKNRVDDDPFFTISAHHAVTWAACTPIFSCRSGTTCPSVFPIGEKPRSLCTFVRDGSSNDRVSWSSYSVRLDFFGNTWIKCDKENRAQGKSEASCKGHGSSSQGGDVCFSNRATGYS